MQNRTNVAGMIGQTIKKHWGLSFFIVIAVISATAAALLPPLVLGKAIDTMTKGRGIPLSMILLYFGFTAVTGLMESLREGLLTLFGQKDHPCAQKRHDAQIYPLDGKFSDSKGAGSSGFKICGGCGHSRKFVYLRNDQYVCGRL